mmetsp:Transcript_97214/g.253329  ORF Transcript_97214/g.253329 Transcript_97214/m.253329 type:complete len:277 (+) Transcript_97214:159-989(+)
MRRHSEQKPRRFLLMPSRPCSLWPPCTQRTAAAREASEDRRVPEGEGSEDDCCDLLRKAGAPLTCLTGLSFPCRSTMTPSPCRWPMAQLPLYIRPSGHVNVPGPFLTPPSNLPANLEPSGSSIEPSPSILPSRHWPSKTRPHGSEPAPSQSTCAPWGWLAHLPLARGSVSLPAPCRRSPSKPPSYRDPSAPYWAPAPDRLSCRHSPSYQLPSGSTCLPAPCRWPRHHCPAYTAPSAPVRVPWPWGLPSEKKPSCRAPRGPTSTPQPCRRSPSHWPR